MPQSLFNYSEFLLVTGDRRDFWVVLCLMWIRGTAPDAAPSAPGGPGFAALDADFAFDAGFV